jgi:hypothetical protein
MCQYLFESAGMSWKIGGGILAAPRLAKKAGFPA